MFRYRAIGVEGFTASNVRLHQKHNSEIAYFYNEDL